MNLKIGKLGILTISALFLISCASTKLSNIEDVEKFEYVDNEKSLWKEVKEVQDKFLKSAAVYEDVELNQYINDVLHKVVGEIENEKGVHLKAYIIKDPNFNAVAYPNGVIFVNTGFLANIDSEAQLATILGHEATHFLHRHYLKDTNNKINLTAFFSTIRAVAIGATYGLAYSGYDPTGVDLARQNIELGLVGALYGYGRNLENEADRVGFDLMTNANYDPNESKAAFENLYEATKVEKWKGQIPYMYQSHPKIKQRIRSFDKLIKNLSKDIKEDRNVVKGEEIYLNKIKELIIFNAEIDILRNKLKLAKRQIEKYNSHFNKDYKSLYLEAKLLLRQDNIEEAIKFLDQSKELNPNFANTLKELGLQYYKTGEKEKARENFKQYLDLQPNALDSDFIRGYLD